MMKEYYIESSKGKVGPYDIVALVRKIRNGTLTPTTLVAQGEETIYKPAQEWPELTDFFQEDVVESSENSSTHVTNHTIVQTLGNGIRFLQSNLISTVFSGVYILSIFVVLGFTLLFPDSFRVGGYVICFILSYLLLSFYLVSVLRMTRGQPVDVNYILSKALPVSGKLFAASCFIVFPASIGLAILAFGLAHSASIMAIIGLFVFAVPGLLALTLFAFAPILIFDQDYTVMKALSTSYKAIIKSGMENFGVLFALQAINFIAGLLAFLPMAITLPITMSALTEIYDEFLG